MALNDLTDPEAVTAAMQEYDAALRGDVNVEFFEKYDFGKDVDYYLEKDGRRYPSKAIAGVAHKYQHGRALQHHEFSGGNATVVARLAKLNFIVTRPASGWTTPIGAVVLRSKLQALYGGSSFGGIEPSASTPNILIFTDEAQGALNGYNYDRWEGPNRSVFYYTGEGRIGDQKFTAGNKAIRDHVDDGRVLRIFETIDKTKRKGGKRQRYEGAFKVDPKQPFDYKTAPDRNGNLRQVIVFKLVRDEMYGSQADFDRQIHTQTDVDAVFQVPVEDDTQTVMLETADGSPNSATVVAVASEQNVADEFEIAPRLGAKARREEAQLVTVYEKLLRSKGHKVHRLRISVPGEPTFLLTDSYDASTRTLYEAKSSADRGTVRLAIGQLLDYLRFLPDVQGCVLLPVQPSGDLSHLIRSCGLQLVYRRGSEWLSG